MITKQLPSLFAIVGIVTIACVAMSYGLDGAFLFSCVGAAAGLGGYAVKQTKTP